MQQEAKKMWKEKKKRVLPLLEDREDQRRGREVDQKNRFWLEL